jgi:hypothetical protein
LVAGQDSTIIRCDAKQSVVRCDSKQNEYLRGNKSGELPRTCAVWSLKEGGDANLVRYPECLPRAHGRTHGVIDHTLAAHTRPLLLVSESLSRYLSLNTSNSEFVSELSRVDHYMGELERGRWRGRGEGEGQTDRQIDRQTDTHSCFVKQHAGIFRSAADSLACWTSSNFCRT